MLLSNYSKSKVNESEALPPKIKTEVISGRTVTIYFPDNYSRDSIYRTVYFHDGQWLFTSDWPMSDMLDKMSKDNQIEPILLVGIHSNESRTSDFLPYSDDWIIQNYGIYTPNAEGMSNLVLNEIVPYMEGRYGASNIPKDRALFGISFGGLHSMWEATRNPDAWGMVASISPSFWVQNYQIFEQIEQSALTSSTKIWFDIGTAEWEYYVPVVQTLVDKGFEYGVNAFYYEIPDADHSVQSWMRRIHMPLIVFAGSWPSNVASWEVVVEFIPSQQSSKVFKRINPIIVLSNGVKYSACSQARYRLLNPEDGELNDDGIFEFNGTIPLEVEVSYLQFKDIIKILPK